MKVTTIDRVNYVCLLQVNPFITPAVTITMHVTPCTKAHTVLPGYWPDSQRYAGQARLNRNHTKLVINYTYIYFAATCTMCLYRVLIDCLKRYACMRSIGG